MFSGIIEEIGIVTRLDLRGDELTLTIGCKRVLPGAVPGGRLAVNGVDLEVASASTDQLTVELETDRGQLGNLRELRSDETVNLERPVVAGQRVGGHYVQGYIDGVGRVAGRREDGRFLGVRIEAPEALRRYLIPRGFIAVDGASLSIAEVHADGFSVRLGAGSRQRFTLPARDVDARVNLEVDVIARYVEQLVGRIWQAQGTAGPDLLRRGGYA